MRENAAERFSGLPSPAKAEATRKPKHSRARERRDTRGKSASENEERVGNWQFQHHPGDRARPPHFPHPIGVFSARRNLPKESCRAKTAQRAGTGGQSIPTIHAQPGSPIERGIETFRDAFQAERG